MSALRQTLLDIYCEALTVDGSLGKNGDDFAKGVIESVELAITITDDQLCRAMLDRCWGRSCAVYEFFDRLGVKWDFPEEPGAYGEDPKECAYIAKVFKSKGRKVPRKLNSHDWST